MVDLKQRPDEDSGIHPEWYKPDADNLEDQFNTPSANDDDLPEGHPSRSDNNTASGDDLAAAEQSPGSPTTTEADKSEQSKIEPSGGWYSRNQDQSKKRGRFSPKQKGVIGGVTAFLAVAGVAITIFITPILKLESFMQGINQRVFGAASSAVEARIEHLAERYIIARVLTLERCTAVVSRECRTTYSEFGMVGNLYKNWDDARVDEKLFREFGLEIETNNNATDGPRHRILLNGQPLAANDGERISQRLRFGSREAGGQLREFLRGETKWYQVMQRRSIRNSITRRHDIRFWCFFACERRDNLDTKLTNVRSRYKFLFVERFVYPYSAKYGFILNCIMRGGQCDPEDISRARQDRTPLSDSEVDEIVADFTEEIVDVDTGERTTRFRQRRLLSYGMERILTKLISKEVAQKAVGAVPVAGQVYLGAWAFDMLNQADEFIDNKGLSRMAAEVNTSQYVDYYTGMRSISDELKSGNLSMAEVGAVTEDLNGAEESLVYQATSSPRTASIFTSSVSAQSSQGGDAYVCADGQPIDDGDLVCDEKKVARTFEIENIRGNRVVDGLSVSLFSNYERCIVTCRAPGPQSLKEAVRGTIGAVETLSDTVLGSLLSGAMSVVEGIPGVGSVVSDFRNFIEQKTTQLIQAFFGKIFPLPVTEDSPGREKFDAMYAGGEVVARDFARGGESENGDQYGLGGQLLSDSEAVAVIADYENKLVDTNRQSGFLARLTNTEDANSLISRVFRSAPTHDQLTKNTFAGFVGTLGKSFANVFSIFGSPVSAQNNLTQSPFGVSRYGYPLGHSAITADPALYTDEYCQQLAEQRDLPANKSTNQVTGEEENMVANPCLLEEAVIEAASAWYTNE